MRRARSGTSTAVAGAVVMAALALVSSCSSSPKATPPSSSTSTSTTSTTTTSPSSATSTSVPSSGSTVALGKNDPAEGDCTTNLSEQGSAVGSVVMTVTSSSFEARIDLQSGTPDASYLVFMQQVPGSCPQQSANGGTLTTDSSGRGQATSTVARVPGATTFFVQLVPPETGPAEYTSDRISTAS
jgi:hypothetical protein